MTYSWKHSCVDWMRCGPWREQVGKVFITWIRNDGDVRAYAVEDATHADMLCACHGASRASMCQNVSRRGMASA